MPVKKGMATRRAADMPRLLQTGSEGRANPAPQNAGAESHRVAPPQFPWGHVFAPNAPARPPSHSPPRPSPSTGRVSVRSIVFVDWPSALPVHGEGEGGGRKSPRIRLTQTLSSCTCSGAVSNPGVGRTQAKRRAGCPPSLLESGRRPHRIPGSAGSYLNCGTHSLGRTTAMSLGRAACAPDHRRRAGRQ